jgi:hypothetical protein
MAVGQRRVEIDVRIAEMQRACLRSVGGEGPKAQLRAIAVTR